MKVILTEAQVLQVLNEEVIMESLFHRGMSFSQIVQAAKEVARKGLLTASLIANIVFMYHLSRSQQEVLEQLTQIEQAQDESLSDKWELLGERDGKPADDVLATVYNAAPAQCNNDVRHTASMFKLNLDDVLSHRIIAMERTMMKEYGLKYGDVVKIEGAGQWDGIWQIQDTMNKRFAGQHKIDILVPNNIKYGKWDNVKIYVPANEQTAEAARAEIG